MSNALQAPEIHPMCETYLSVDGKWELFASLGERGHGLRFPGDPAKFLVHEGVFFKNGKIKAWKYAVERFETFAEAEAFIAERIAA